MSRFEPQWGAAADAIHAADTILLVSHIAPDGDAVGSTLGLFHCLRDMGKSVTAAIDGGAPVSLRFLRGSDSILPKVERGKFDLLVTLDSSDLSRIGKSGAYGMAHSQSIINLDHHPTNTGFGDIMLVAPEAVAAAEIVFDLVEFMALEPSQPSAVAILTGLVTDTRGFRINATNSRTLEIAQALMQRGADLPQIMARTLNRRSYKDVLLWKAAFPSIALNGGLIHAAITQADLRAAGLTEMTDGGLVNHLLAVDQAKVSVVFKALPGDEVEVGFRAKPGFDVAQLALRLGGGGHTLASGCTLSGTLAQAKAQVLPLARQVIAEGKASLAPD